MRRPLALFIGSILLAGACTLGNDERDAAEELTEIATSADGMGYKATYRFGISGELAPAVETVMEIVQEPPQSLRRIQATTLDADGGRVTVSQWLIDREEGSFACADYADGVKCVSRPAPTGVFGYAQVDEMLRAVRDPENFRAVERTDRVRIAGEEGTCFMAAPQPATPAPVRSPQPRFTPTVYRFEFCYTPDGILLRARRRIVGDVPEDLRGRTEATLEATAVSRSVGPEDLRMPGPVDDGSGG